jgi:hypothetical protein
MIKVKKDGSLREADDEEVEGIDAHRKENPKCNGSQIVDRGVEDQSFWVARPGLWCNSCEERVPVPT